ncbi:DNA-binding protein [Fibrisoma montanum]|uniref:DNA-binding protein n=1 Tax=Fibrisoma montanum TaxID=2305895 RepID=A0A418MJ77_9BACT|nr:helix-turn-helix domain-containing protein [Fibrisoma montanum]RIV27381.1 DNA-binding protein [Fibrisoma montanum]
MYGTVIQITMTPEQLTQLLDERLANALANYTPPKPEGAVLPDLMTRKQTAETLQVSLTTLNDWAKDRDDRPAILIPRKINGRVRYHRADVLAAMKESRRFKQNRSI